MSTKPQTIDGKQALLEFAKAHHPRHEHTIVSLEKALRRIGFDVADTNEDRVIIAGPLQTTTACKTLVQFGGALRVRHFDLVKALERLLEVGLPVWKTEAQQFEWHLARLAECESYQIPAVEPYETREELEAHVSTCVRCQPSYRTLLSALELGSNRHEDKHLRELIEKAHSDQDAALAFYQQIRDSQRPAFMPIDKPQRAKREVVA